MQNRTLGAIALPLLLLAPMLTSCTASRFLNPPTPNASAATNSSSFPATRSMLSQLADWGFDPLAELQPHGQRGLHPLPFVYVFGRSHFTVSYFGANIYPENVTVGLEQPDIQDWVTGKFVLQVKEDADRNRFLSVVVELAPGADSSDDKQQTLARAILTQLLRLNSEFANYVPAEYQLPQVTLAPTGDPDYFPIGVKHRYTRQTGPEPNE